MATRKTDHSTALEKDLATFRRFFVQLCGESRHAVIVVAKTLVQADRETVRLYKRAERLHGKKAHRSS